MVMNDGGDVDDGDVPSCRTITCCSVNDAKTQTANLDVRRARPYFKSRGPKAGDAKRDHRFPTISG